MKVVCLPTLVVDTYPVQQLTRLGGNSLNCAVQYRKLGADSVTVVGAVGNDPEGRAITGFLNGAGINTMIEVMDGRTATNQMMVDEHGERSSRPGSWKGGVLDSWMLRDEHLELINRQDLCAVSGHGENFERLVQHAVPGLKITADYMHFGDFDLLDRTLDRVDVAFMAGGEAFLEGARDASARHRKPVVVTMDAAGSMGFNGGKAYRQPALPVDRIIDTTGCGDAYQSACAYRFFMTGDFKAAMLDGARAASRVLAFYGGVGESGQSR